MTNVTFVWEDGKKTNESFKNQEDVFAYLKAMKNEENQKIKEFFTDPIKPSWCF